MAWLVQPRLVNEPFSDPALLLDFAFARRALLFDLGDLAALSAREIIRTTHAFVSHMHMDHFAGFDRLLRLNLYQSRTVHLLGPPGLCEAVAAKLAAYTWNLLGPHSADFRLLAEEWSPAGAGRRSLFPAQDAFRRQELAPRAAGGRVLLEEADFMVETARLDHGIPCLAFAFQETLRVNVHRPALEVAGLPVGPWLTAAKQALRRGDPAGTEILLGPQGSVPLGFLREKGILHTGPGQRITYATDLACSPANVEALTELARGSDMLFIEAAFLEEDRAMAARKNHLTAAQAGGIARAAGVAHARPMHFSARYLGQEEALRREFEAAFRGAR
ncbi:MBL fold metallo-hydrolase [Roseomonas sp. E05]|uniref:ribonuclease Z n=1 Tax=Roseomonas sp. E05 TaxID=3046310 RepID=UPI0024BB9770|nr:MBL fold metallo-hydrolase [Roseomonas sp. E05]MDJ0386955.1 MBL fold metallo-hydrolase [Roseomonas sp. E05]